MWKQVLKEKTRKMNDLCILYIKNKSKNNKRKYYIVILLMTLIHLKIEKI